ncbi:beta-ketoacyl-[acyl-carrier-protein] synthase family protein [Kitasatospora purpeofusca]|uniref:beta-ketoacyl-[acyl-carrier-protein] synthase family protein n=1 Tax=Kitasatospora purpeofusca TaxID=67352 RepID=UPI0022587195|nr:beta-ketoacyl-[acyl-carrier-protein] synthase family protein [Kitasatospora purpeofusca]MCX4682832.1 beta-ketoacyl-[acyl-carrier-protein] synthase family protein [Kitasatospora purpeofusca]
MSAAQPPLAVTGIGLVTPAGHGAGPTWRGVLGALGTAAPDPALAGLPVVLSCRVPEDSAAPAGGRRSWQLDRATRFALAAAREAVADAGLDPARWDGARVAVVLGSAAGGVGSYEHAAERLRTLGPAAVSPMTLPAFLPNMAAGRLAIEFGATGPVMHTATACASGATAIHTAALLLRTGACDVALAGGTDAMITPVCVSGFARMKALSRNPDPTLASRPFDADRDGFVIGEGAGFLVLERRADAMSRQAVPRALLVGAGAAADAFHPVAPHPDARGLEGATRLALAEAGAVLDDVDHINAHGTSTPLNDSAEARLIHRLFARRPPSVTSAKGVLGHTMGAAGAIEAALTVLTVQHQLVPGTAGFALPDRDTARIDLVLDGPRRQRLRLALSTSAGFGGHNTALAFAPAGPPPG